MAKAHLGERLGELGSPRDSMVMGLSPECCLTPWRKRWGRVEVAEEATDISVKEDNNLSLIEYELVSVEA
ncbi:hypothetical protein F2Q70_00041892 [Brassica cretica]|uniref:Uncharacterized protein n=1 Tax=Brassica cretica TaxID=69181 RepID=A0A8S9K494_BRACR|nr:hypothetical protein F2Q70_00041892 [Brassica cretica]